MRARDYLSQLTDDLEGFRFTGLLCVSSFCSLKENVDQMHIGTYKLKLRKFKGCKLHQLEGRF